MTLGANVQPKKDLFRYCDTTSSSKSSNQERRVLISVRFPTPHGWQCIDQGDYQSFWKVVPMESIFPADRSSHKTGAAREEMCFVYLACVQLREKGYLNDHNKAPSGIWFETKRMCALGETWSAMSINHVVFQSA